MTAVAELRFSPGEVIARQGDTVDSIFRLKSGTVQSSLVNSPRDDVGSSERRVVAVTTEPGVLLGEGGLLLDQRSTTLIAETEVVVEAIGISAAGLARAILKRPDLGLALAESIAKRLSDMAHGLRLVDSYVFSIQRHIDSHSTAFRQIVGELALRKGRLGELGREAQSTATFQRGRMIAREKESRDKVVRSLNATKRSAIRELSAGEWLLREGDVLENMYVLLAGRMQVYAGGIVIDEISPSETVGEIGALLARELRHVAGVKATEPSRVLAISYGTLADVSVERPPLVLHIVKSLSRRLVRSYAVLSDLDASLKNLLDELDGPEGSVTSDYQGVGHALAEWSDEVPEAIKDLSENLADARSCAQQIRASLIHEERATRDGLSFSEIRARHEFASAESCIRRVLSRISAASDGSEALDVSADLAEAGRAMRNFASLRGRHSHGGAGERRLPEHAAGVGVWASLIAERLGFGKRESEELVVAAVLHDVGMMGAEGRAGFRMDKHPTEYAAPFLARISGLSAEVFQAVCQHHEFVDGSGYPRRLVGDRISRAGKVLSAANQMDLLLAKGLPPRQAAEHMRTEASRYDPEVLSALLEIAGR